MSPAPELSLALCTYAAAAPAAGLAAMPGPCTASLSQQLATGSCELLDKAGFSLRRDTSFLDMDELCTCHGACDKALFLIPEDNVAASTSQQPVSEVASSLPAGLHAHVVASCCEPDEDAPSGCCFEKALQYLAMVDAPEEQYQQQQQTSRTFCPSPRSHHCLAGAQSPACSDSDDDMPSVRRSSQCMVTASTTATATSPFEAAVLAATEAASAAASRPEPVAVLAPIAAAPCQPSASAAASAVCAPASMPAVVHLARSSGPSATRNANITLAMQFPQVITTEVLAVPAASGTAATTATAANNNGMGAAAVAPASPSPAASGVNGAVSAAAAAMAAEVSAVQQSVSCEAAVAAAPVPRAFHHKTGGPCDHCGATESPQWRRGPASKPTLCNACGTRYRRTNQLGPPSNSQAARAERAAQQAAAAAAAAANGAAAGAPGCAAGAAAAGTQQVRRNAKRDASAAVAVAVSGLLPAAKRQRTVAPIDMEL